MIYFQNLLNFGILSLFVPLLISCSSDENVTLYYANCLNGLTIKPTNLLGKSLSNKLDSSFDGDLFRADWKKNEESRKACALQPWISTDYKINYVKYEIYQKNSNASLHLTKLTDCAIESKDNWICKLGNDSIVVVKNGLEVLPKSNWERNEKNALFSVSSFTYWYATIYIFIFGKYPQMGDFIPRQDYAIDSDDTKYFLRKNEIVK
jgi:hypothetical protein